MLLVGLLGRRRQRHEHCLGLEGFGRMCIGDGWLGNETKQTSTGDASERMYMIKDSF